MTTAEARREWARLRATYGELSPVEESLISPVMAVVQVLKLPSGGQLGYRGNVINFALDVAQARSSAPRACLARDSTGSVLSFSRRSRASCRGRDRKLAS